jgi:hypothetical protein
MDAVANIGAADGPKGEAQDVPSQRGSSPESLPAIRKKPAFSGGPSMRVIATVRLGLFAPSMGLTPPRCALRGQRCALSKFVPNKFVEHKVRVRKVSQPYAKSPPFRAGFLRMAGRLGPDSPCPKPLTEKPFWRRHTRKV